jgi:isocitrate/isopropylmalate dehydrogenase
VAGGYLPGSEKRVPLSAGIISDGVDILVVRRLTGGIYFGERGRKNVCRTAQMRLTIPSSTAPPRLNA